MPPRNCTCLVVVLVLFVLFLLYFAINTQEPFINYDTGEKSYLVLEKKPNYENAASILNTIDNNILLLIEYFNQKYSYIHKYDNNPKNQMLFNIRNRLNTSYKSNSLRENFPIKKGRDVSYNVNKGEDISLCLRNYNEPAKFHDINDISFVALHELAHSCNDSYGHDTSFWKIFRIILENAIEINIFKNYNYRRDSVNYCSINITYNPIFDSLLDDCNYFD